MRDAVHRKLTETRPSTLRVLLGVLDGVSSNQKVNEPSCRHYLER
jgi:hypothetical protein